MEIATITKIVELIMALVGVVITTFVIPYINSKYSATELEKLKEYITFGVRCAEMYFDTTDGRMKKEYVRNYVKGVIGDLVHTDITDDQLDILIEGVVQNVKYSGEK